MTAKCDLNALDAASAGEGCARAWMDHNLRMTDILTVGTHNSYHQAISEPIMQIVRRAAPDTWGGLDYAHPPLTEQLDDGARALELDIYHDPQGGHYARPAGMVITHQEISPDYIEAMSKPGLKVMHIQDIDFRSSVVTYVQGLQEIRTWSLAHPDHTPILLTMNTSDGKTRMPGGADGVLFDEAAYDGLDAEIASVFPPGAVITPDIVRAGARTLREAVLETGWPRLGEARGKIFIAIDETDRRRDAYRRGRQSLEGCMCFVNSDEDAPDNAYYTLNETSDGPRTAALVKAGFMVRTRADADTREARTNDTTRREAAFLCGAQYVCTDYRRPDLRFSDYQVRLPNEAITIANPQRAPERCAGMPIE
jgi:Phosphoinositide phospholipase C, Ca2+-dependent